MGKILVCPVAYNENVKLKNVITRFLRCPVKAKVDFLVIDDASTDGTTQIIESYAEQGVRTIKHQDRKGVGSAIRTAIEYARKEHYEILVIMAGNDKDNPDEISRLINPILNDGYDFVQGSRYKGANGIGGDMPLYRIVGTKIYPILMSFVAKKKITDGSNGFRAFRLSLFDDKNIDIHQEWLNQYELEPYLMIKAIQLGYKFTEAPVTKVYPPKQLGYTKMKPVTGWWSIFRPLVFLALGIRK